MGFASYSTSQHCCYISDALASPLQALHKSLSTSPQFSGVQDTTFETAPSSIGHLSKWRVISISEWQSGCSKPLSSGETAITSPQEDISALFDHRGPASACHCSATHLCGPYLAVELTRPCGCRQSVQVRVNAYSERFVFLDGVAVSFPTEGAFGSDGTDSTSDDDLSVDQLSISTHLSGSDCPSSPFFPSQASTPETPLPGTLSPSSELFVKYFQFPVTSKRFSLIDLALLLNAVQREHADHRWTDSYADRSLIEFTAAEVFAFLDYFLELDWRNQVLEYRRSIAKRFYDKRVVAWNSWISSSPSKSIDSGELLSSSHSSSQLTGSEDKGTESQTQELDLERRLLSCMKDRVAFVNDELRLLWLSLAAQKCALQASKMRLDEVEEF